jgi:hypothetical protein
MRPTTDGRSLLFHHEQDGQMLGVDIRAIESNDTCGCILYQDNLNSSDHESSSAVSTRHRLSCPLAHRSGWQSSTRHPGFFGSEISCMHRRQRSGSLHFHSPSFSSIIHSNNTTVPLTRSCPPEGSIAYHQTRSTRHYCPRHQLRFSADHIPNPGDYSSRNISKPLGPVLSN